MIVVRPDFVQKLADVKDAVVAVEGATGQAAENGRAAGFIVVDVAIHVTKHFVARLRVDLDANLIRHRARWAKQPGLFAEKTRHTVFQTIDGRVFMVNVVADLGRVHGGSHSRRRPRDRIAAHVDDCFGHGTFQVGITA